MVVLWLALRLALGRGSWWVVGVAAGIGLETKYTLAVVLVLLAVGFLIWNRAVLRSAGCVVALVLAGLLLVPNLLWEAAHGWTSVHFFLNPPPSATQESRPQYVANLLLLTHPVAVPVAVAGITSLVRERALRPLGWTVVATVIAYLVLGGKSYYALPAVLFALAAGAVPFECWATTRRLRRLGIAFFVVLIAVMPIGLPVLPLHTADRLGVLAARSDYKDAVGWPALASMSRTRSSNAIASASASPLFSDSIGTACRTVGRSARGAPPTRSVGESGVASSGYWASSSCSSANSRSNSESGISGASSM